MSRGHGHPDRSAAALGRSRADRAEAPAAAGSVEARESRGLTGCRWKANSYASTRTWGERRARLSGCQRPRLTVPHSRAPIGQSTGSGSRLTTRGQPSRPAPRSPHHLCLSSSRKHPASAVCQRGWCSSRRQGHRQVRTHASGSRRPAELGHVDRCTQGAVDQVFPVRSHLDSIESDVGDRGLDEEGRGCCVVRTQPCTKRPWHRGDRGGRLALLISTRSSAKVAGEDRAGDEDSAKLELA